MALFLAADLGGSHLHIVGGTGPTFPANGYYHADEEMLTYASADVSAVGPMDKTI